MISKGVLLPINEVLNLLKGRSCDHLRGAAWHCDLKRWASQPEIADSILQPSPNSFFQAASSVLDMTVKLTPQTILSHCQKATFWWFIPVVGKFPPVFALQIIWSMWGEYGTDDCFSHCISPPRWRLPEMEELICPYVSLRMTDNDSILNRCTLGNNVSIVCYRFWAKLKITDTECWWQLLNTSRTGLSKCAR